MNSIDFLWGVASTLFCLLVLFYFLDKIEKRGKLRILKLQNLIHKEIINSNIITNLRAQVMVLERDNQKKGKK